ncbi:hypothetical protein AB0910_04580 [Streptomyces sp. NPDC047002]|uniref:hypothetical protein n=1 Tax=Streptomyces sp. NPDC047002 TaxID=3155475 RepID=UPI0034521901
MTEGMDIPEPEAGWEAAFRYQGGKKNPALQYGLWEYVTEVLRPVAVLDAPLAGLADRLRLEVEESWSDLGEVRVAAFRLKRRYFAFHQSKDDESMGTAVFLHRQHADVEEALDALLEALGTGRELILQRVEER